MGQRGEAAALGLGEMEPSASELRFEDTVFREEIGDDLLLVPLQLAGHHSNEHVQDHGVPRVESRAVSVHSSILPT